MMMVAAAVAEILKREGVDYLIGYPVNPIIEAAAAADIRTIIVRQERTGLHMADAVSRVTSGERIGVFAMQFGPGTENAFGGVAQAFGESVPIVVLPGGYPRTLAAVPPNFSAYLNFQHITKSAEQVTVAAAVPDALRRAFTQVKNGRPRPVLVEIPKDVFDEELPAPLTYQPTPRVRSGPDPERDRRGRAGAGGGQAAGHLRRAGRPLRARPGRSCGRWPNSSRRRSPPACKGRAPSRRITRSPLAPAAGQSRNRCITSSPTPTSSSGLVAALRRPPTAWPCPLGKTIIHATLDPADINHTVPVDYALAGDAGLTLDALLGEVQERLGGAARGRFDAVAGEIAAVKASWLDAWQPKLSSDEVPLSPYRVIRDLLATVDVANTIITHDAGSPRDQLSPFWVSQEPLSYLGWGKTTQLGYGLGLAMGAKLAKPDKLCINVWGDAAIGFTGMDFETAVRERLPILSILLNNFSMAIELPIMRQATAKYRSTDISGDYAAFARALGGYGERVTEPGQIVPAIQRAIRQTQEGTPALLEFITAQEITFSTF